MSVNPRQPEGKYMDITHPAYVRPSTTSKPVIVGNRPILVSDPMIAELAERAVTAHKTYEGSSLVDAETESSHKIVEPPAGSSTAPSLFKHREEAEEEVPETDAPASATTEPVAAAVSETPTAPEDAIKPDIETREATESHKEATKVHETLVPNAAVLTTPVIDTGTEPDTPTPEDEAAAHAEQIIADGTYFLPIGQAKHRGQRVVFGLCLIVVLAVVVLDVLLDTGIVSLSMIPHTTFFGS